MGLGALRRGLGQVRRRHASAGLDAVDKGAPLAHLNGLL